MRLIPALLLALLPAAPAAAYLADNGLVVEPIGKGEFHVPYRGYSRLGEFWCAAGDYGVRVLHLPPGQLIYRASEPPRRSGEGIRFTLDPEAAASTTGFTTYGGQGAGMTARAAQSHCRNQFQLPGH